VSRNHGIWRVYVLCLLAAYCIIRFFFISPILSDTYFSTAYYDRGGRLLRLTLSEDDKYRLFVPLSKISASIKNATILYEDKYFYYHPGVNPVALARAAARYLSQSDFGPGASTITMQVARLRYNLDTKTVGGKIRQIFAAVYLDMFHTKGEILEAYLNLAPYGGNTEGIGAASLIYFGKSANSLSQIESITLATVPQNPAKRGLNTDAGLRNMTDMRRDLARRWLARYPDSSGRLTTLADMPLSVGRIADMPFCAPHFVNMEMQKSSANHFRAAGVRDSEITTTLDLGLQKKLESVMSAEIAKRRGAGVRNAAAVLVNYKTMELASYLGSADYFDKSIFGQNDGVMAKRSPGSTLKPFIYAAAADQGLIHGMTLLKDTKISFGVYAPENSDSEFFGPVLAKDALVNSRNIPAIELARKIGVRNFYRFMADCGVAGLRAPDHYGISIALGGAEFSMWELARLYAMMANLGTLRDIRTIAGGAPGAETKMLSPEAFFLVLDMLGDQSAMSPKVPFAKRPSAALRHYWKTGTSSSFRDAWTAGIFGDFVLIVWVGNFDGAPNNAFSGIKTAAPIYFALSRAVTDYYASKGRPLADNDFYSPDLNVSRVDMCAGVGGLAGPYCPHPVPAYFIPGKSPIDESRVYRAVPIDIKTGLRACVNDPKTTRAAVFEFWDPEYLDMFRAAGIVRKTPPPFMPGCNPADLSSERDMPVIISPINKTKVVILSGRDSETVSFKALAGGGDEKIFWFLGPSLIGTSQSGKVFQYGVGIGEYRLRAVTDAGAAAEIEFSVVK